MKTGLCIASGGSKGYVAIPVIKRMLMEDISFDCISGSSIGSIIGAYLSLHGNLDGLEEIILDLSSLKALKLVDPDRRLKYSVVKGKKVRQFLDEKLFQGKTFADLKIPLIINATDFAAGKTVYFRSGPLIDAVMASICIPGVFPPYEIAGKRYIDGGVTEPMPYRCLFEAGMDKVICIHLNKLFEEELKEIKLPQVLMRTFIIFQNLLSEIKPDKNLYIIAPELPGPLNNILRFHDYKPYRDLGSEIIERELPGLKGWMNNINTEQV